MGHYIHFTPQEIEQASNTDIADLLRRQGEKLTPSGSELQWGNGSSKITVRGSVWYHQYGKYGGDAISFVRNFYNKSFPEAVQFLLGRECGVVAKRAEPRPTQPKESKQFQLPSANDNMRRVYAYLIHERGLDRRVVDVFTHKKMIYESAETHNVVFVGYDKNGIPRHAQKRSTASEGTYKGNASGSMMEHSFHWHGSSPNLFLFEAPIDMLSYITMLDKDWQQHSYAAACSVTDKVLFQMMQDNPKIQNVFVCFDNDEAGQTAAQKLCAKLSSMNISACTLVPLHKDWNEDLLYSQKQDQQSGIQQAM